MSQFSNQDIKDWFVHPMTQEFLGEIKSLRKEVFESILCTPRDERADVTFRIEGMDLILSKLKEKGV